MAGATTLAALLAAHFIQRGTGSFPFTVLVLPVILSAWVGELFGGLFSALLLAVLTPLALPPLWRWTPLTEDEFVRLTVLVAVGTIVGVTIGRRHRVAAMLQAVVASASEGILVSDADGTILHINPAAEMLMGWTASEVQGRPLSEVLALAKEGSGQSIESVRHPWSSPSRHDVLLRARNGGEVPVNLTTAPVHAADGTYIGTVVMFRDEGGRRQREQELREARDRAETARRDAEAANLEKNRFIARVSHELRTPLTVLVGWTQMLHAGQVPPRQMAHAIATLDRTAALLTRLVEDLVDMSRISAGALHLERTLTDFTLAVREAVDMLRHTADEKGVAVSVNIASEPVFVTGDAVRLRQIVWNLVSNAVKFTPAGGAVTVSVRCLDERVELRVDDTGRGISSEFLPYVFDPFAQADRTGGSASGLGLGLNIVQQLVTAHGGRVTVASDGPGKGASFTVLLPLTSSQDTPAPPHATLVQK